MSAGGWTCPAPLATHDRITLGHGGGGRLSSDLVEHLFLPAYGDAAAGFELTDAAVLPEVGGGSLAFTTDGFVVQPLRFPGGSIGHLAVNGTVNDLAMRGARPIALSVAFVLEEGLSLRLLAEIAADVGAAALEAGVAVVTGDTKVVGVGQADGCYITTAGVGSVPAGLEIAPHMARVGDAVVLSGPIGQHGVAVLSERDEFDFGTEVVSDTAPLASLVDSMVRATSGVHVLRDPTRGGLAATLCELASAAGCGIEFAEASVPVPRGVATACGFLGLDAMHLACEGRLVALVAPEDLDPLLSSMRSHPAGADAVVIGHVVAEHPGVVVERTALGGTRIVDPPLGEQLPRIC